MATATLCAVASWVVRGKGWWGRCGIACEAFAACCFRSQAANHRLAVGMSGAGGGAAEFGAAALPDGAGVLGGRGRPHTAARARRRRHLRRRGRQCAPHLPFPRTRTRARNSGPSPHPLKLRHIARVERDLAPGVLAGARLFDILAESSEPLARATRRFLSFQTKLVWNRALVTARQG